MCNDENGAPHAVRYLNAQLAVLHTNAKKCLEEHSQARSVENRHSYALAEFSVQKPGTFDVAFQATFDKPQLDFICDHDVILHLTIENSRFSIDGLRPGPIGQYAELPKRLTVSYRLGFETRKVVGGNDCKADDYTSMVQLVILDLQKATFMSAEPEVAIGREQLIRYLSQYLNHLYEAGHHVLFSLPQFDLDRNTLKTIDYSLMSTTQYLVENIHGITAEQINTYMSSNWLKSAMLAHGITKQGSADWRSRVLAEFSTWSLGQNGYGLFRAKMVSPHVEILCSKEVVVYYNISELEFFKDEDVTVPPIRKYKDWKIAMVVNVLYSTEADGQLVNIMFDSSRARFHDAASEYSDLQEDDELGNEFWNCVVTFFSEEYTHILETARYHTIYCRDSRWESMSKTTCSEDVDGSWWNLEVTDSNGALSRETVQRTRMCGFDQIISISQGSINAQFDTLAADLQSMFHRWSYGNCFAASFKPMNLRLLSDNRAIVWVHLLGGHLKTLRDWEPWDGSMKYDFGEWSLAFEVELKMCSHEELEGACCEAYKKSLAFREHGHGLDRDLHHIYLDLRNAEFLYDYSTISDQSCGGDYRSSIIKLQAVVYYLTQHYFPAICKDAQNVISSVPVWKAGKSLPSYALTNAAFQVYSKCEVNRHNWAHVTAGLEPILVVFGMTGFRSMPAERLDYSTGWIVYGSKGFSHGTVSISQRVFIEERLLSLLSRVNALTTLIPTTPDVFQTFQGLRLQPWAEHEKRKDRPSKWELQPSDGEGAPLKYLWEHSEEWRYNLRGSGNILSAAQAISCITRNYVELPTAVKQGALRIKIGGKVDLNLNLQTTQSYTASSSVNWSTHITVQTVGSGIKIDTLGSHDPVFTKAEFSDGAAAKFRNPMDMLREAFPAKVDLDELVKEIQAFEGVWQYCYPVAHSYSLASPVFNDAGDLLFELRRHGPAIARLAAPITAHNGRSSPAPRRIGRARTPVGNVKSPTVRSPIPRSPSRIGLPAIVQPSLVAPQPVRSEHVSIVTGSVTSSSTFLGYGMDLDA